MRLPDSFAGYRPHPTGSSLKGDRAPSGDVLDGEWKPALQVHDGTAIVCLGC
jgi:hypothetical protein